MRHLTLLSSCLALSLLLGTSYAAERLVVFGDSLSDDGYSFTLSGGLLPPGPSGPPGLLMAIMAKHSMDREKFFWAASPTGATGWITFRRMQVVLASKFQW